MSSDNLSLAESPGHRVSLRSAAVMGNGSWKTVHVDSDCPWMIYRRKLSCRKQKLLIFPKRQLHSFLSDIPDTVPLSSLMLPGTHDTMAFYGWPVSQCQFPETPLATQLRSGIRVLDIRLSVVDSRLIAYHGIYPQQASFQHILSILYDFLRGSETCRECVVMSIKQEDFATVPWYVFSQSVRDEIHASKGGFALWFLENRLPTLGEVRGKIVMFSRFGGDGSGWQGGLEGLGIHPSTWPDSEKYGFTWECKNTLVRTHDWYNIPSFLAIPEKVSLSTEILLPPDDIPAPVLSISYFSAASFPLAFPPTVARGFGWPKWGLGVEGVNSRIGRWLIDNFDDHPQLSATSEKDLDRGARGPRLRGWALMDYFTDPKDAIVPLLVEYNFRGRCFGEEGWM